MKNLVWTLLKIGCVAVYAMALASLFGWLEPAHAQRSQLLALVLLGLHLLELPFVLKHLRRYQGPLAVSVLLNLLFGLLHWVPLARAAKTTGG